MIVTRQLQDHVGWVDNSSIKKKILKYNDKLDDYDLMNWIISDIFICLVFYAYFNINKYYLINKISYIFVREIDQTKAYDFLTAPKSGL